jgi:hypothetical protein
MQDQIQRVLKSGNSGPPTGGRTRPLLPADLSQIVDLYLKVFPLVRQYSRERLFDRFRRVLLQNPWYNPSIPSLVYEKNGKVCGFLGVVVRPMFLGAEVIHVATSNHFMVDPSARSSMAGLELLNNLFAGSQDLTIAESGDDSRKLWEALGGRTSFARSLFWTRLLRPTRYALYQLRQRHAPQVLAWIAGPVCGAFDTLAARVRQSPLYQAPMGPGEETSAKGLVNCFSQFHKRNSLYPCYDEYSLSWLLSLLAKKGKFGALSCVIVTGNKGEIIGWYIYYLNSGAVSTVLHIDAAPGRLDQVFRHLCYHAWRRGSIALTGRVEPRFTQMFCRNRCFLHWRSWMLVHSRNPRILSAFDGGASIFTALEGEWWISVEGDPPE